jgi:hypothetical protein
MCCILNSFRDGPHCVKRLTRSEIARVLARACPMLAGDRRHSAGACIGAIPLGGKEAGSFNRCAAGRTNHEMCFDDPASAREMGRCLRPPRAERVPERDGGS